AGVAHNNLGFQHQLRGNLDAAEAEYRTALRILRGQLGLDHWQVAIAMRNLATVLLAQGEAEAAEPLVRQALEIFENDHPMVKHWRIADAESVLGGCLAARGQLREAESLLTQSYPVIQAKKGTNARETREALERLELLEKTRAARGRR
ncbi:MAG: tetratricopeptide repeat protein, partial [bacterium]|nr:tetratricopeptide repeat protein [bacterium]